jgi:hypothetical protein
LPSADLAVPRVERDCGAAAVDPPLCRARRGFGVFAAVPKSGAARNVTFTQIAVARLQQINMNLS